MKSLYKTLATAAGAGLIALGVYQFKDCTPVRDNPNLTPQVSQIISLQKDLEKVRKQFFETYNSRPETAHIWSFDDKSRQLLDRLNEPTVTKLKILEELSKTYDDEIDRLTMTNQTWKNYCQWNKETKAKNKSNLIYGLISALSGLGLLALSRKN